MEQTSTVRSRKLPHEYSTNPNTIRARRRKAGLTPFAKEVEQAKSSDSKAVTRAWKVQVEKQSYKNATPEGRKTMLEEIETSVMERRRNQGLDADSKIERFIQRMSVTSSLPPNDGDSQVDPTTASSMQPPPRPSAPRFTRRMSVAPSLPPDEDDSKVDPSILAEPMQPAARSLAPIAEMITPPSLSSRPTNSRYATPLPYLLDAMSPVDRRQQIPSSPSHTSHGYDNIEGSMVDHLQGELASLATRNAYLQRDLYETKNRVSELEGTVEWLDSELVVAKASVVSQRVRLEAMDNRMGKHDDTVALVGSAERNFSYQAEKLRRVIQGVQMIAEVASQVAKDLSGEVESEHNTAEGSANASNERTASMEVDPTR